MADRIRDRPLVSLAIRPPRRCWFSNAPINSAYSEHAPAFLTGRTRGHPRPSPMPHGPHKVALVITLSTDTHTGLANVGEAAPNGSLLGHSTYDEKVVPLGSR